MRGPMARPTSDQPQLSKRLIEDTALLLIDAEGLEKMSMRRLARQLGVAPGSLYHWIPNKKALLDDLCARALATVDLPPPDPSIDWRAELRRVCHSFRSLWLTHPGFVPVLIQHSGPNPTELMLHERLDAALESAGVEAGHRAAAIEVLPAFLFGVMVSEHRGDFSRQRAEAMQAIAQQAPDTFPRMVSRGYVPADVMFEKTLQFLIFAIDGMCDAAAKSG